MSWTLIFPESGFVELRSNLIASAPNEAGAMLRCSRSGESRLLVNAVHVATADECKIQGRDRLEFQPAFVARVVKAAREERQSIILVHTHPFAAEPEFSPVDDAGEAALIPALEARVAGVRHGALVLGETGFRGRVYDESGPSSIDRIVEVGAEVREKAQSFTAFDVEEVHDRNVRAFGREGQQRLAQLKVAIVGLGGTGSIIADQLAHLGVGNLILIDDDKLALTNLNRVVGTRPVDVGRYKVEVAAEHVKKLSGGRVRAHPYIGNIVYERFGRPLLTADAIFGCTDTHGSRAVLNQIAYQHLVPVFDMGVRIDAVEGRVTAMAGRVQMLAPGLACLQCQALLDPEAVRRDLMTEEARRADPYIVGEEEPQPAVISLNGAVASLASTMFLAAFAGLPCNPRRLNYRIGEGVVRPVSAAPNLSCVVCSLARGALGKGERWPMIWRMD